MVWVAELYDNRDSLFLSWGFMVKHMQSVKRWPSGGSDTTEYSIMHRGMDGFTRH